MMDAEKITLFLKEKLKNDDRVITIPPSNVILMFYFRYHHIPSKYLTSKALSPSSIYVIVNNTAGQSLDLLLNYAKIEDRNKFLLIKKYPSGSIYRSTMND
jgi:hypothetical protein